MKKFFAAGLSLALAVSPVAAASPASSLSISNSQRAASDVEGNDLTGTLLWVAISVAAAAALAYLVIEITDEGAVPESA
ncbi:hypothetical protein [Allosphingosinicella flava]|uniref:hypothetical protein n=1 Tax=Allosphingosinicella flava TaxID=2771430 RepID=UPI001CF7B091|nr:hypothetical protein [Sphingosinicella flava]